MSNYEVDKMTVFLILLYFFSMIMFFGMIGEGNISRRINFTCVFCFLLILIIIVTFKIMQ